MSIRIPLAVVAALALHGATASAQLVAPIGAPPGTQRPDALPKPPIPPNAQPDAPQPSAPPSTPALAPATPWPTSQWGAAPAPPPTNVVVMPPGYWEQPGLFPRDVDVEDRRVPPPPGYRLDREARKPLWLAGTIIFTVTHAVTAFTGGLLWSTGDSEFEEAGLLMVPVVGPVIWAPVAKGVESDEGRATFAGMSLLTAIQATGLGLLIGGFVLKKPVYRRNDVAFREAPADDTTVTLVPTPSGATLSFTF